jgi:putative ABC transport system permease protein
MMRRSEVKLRKQSDKPPKIPEYIIGYMFPDDNYYTTVSDIEEDYKGLLIKKGVYYAKMWYWLQVLSALPHYFAQKLKWSIVMFKNYIKIAFRNMKRHKGYSTINILGLATGFACTFLIVVFVQRELSYDQFHSKSDRIYRLLNSSSKEPNIQSALSASGYAPRILNDFPEVEETTRFFINVGSADLKYQDESRTVNGFIFADASMLNIFDFPITKGKTDSPLDAPNSLMVTEDTAKIWFRNDNPIGKSITYLRGNLRIPLNITAVLDNIPSNSHIQFNYVVSFPTIKNFMGENALDEFTINNYYTYILLKEGTDFRRVEEKFPFFITKHFDQERADQFNLHLQPLDNIHLNPSIKWDLPTTGNKHYLHIFSGVALFVLLIACINFINLSTARAPLRAREIGIRKVVGSSRWQLLLQLFGESAMTSLTALVIALLGLHVLVHGLAGLIGQNLSFNLINDSNIVIILIGIGILAGILAGIYPAFVLSAYQPVRVLKGSATKGTRGSTLRKALIIIQFSLSMLLIVSMLIVINQINFMKNTPLGFDKEQVILVSLSGSVKQNFGVFRKKLLDQSDIQNVALTVVPGRVRTRSAYNWPGGDDDEEERNFYTMFVDPRTIPTLGMEIIEGRNFSEKVQTDVTRAYILNETAVKAIGWEKAVGKPFRVWDEEMGQVIGVVKDFHFKSLHNLIEPLVLKIKPEWTWNAAVRVSAAGVSKALQKIQEAWRELETEIPIKYKFLDSDFDRHYHSEERLGKLFGIFTGLAIFIACLGLLGLASFSTQQRFKEIGIRKVLGASFRDIFTLFVKEFSRLVLYSLLIATPVTYWLMASWLGDYAYRIRIGIFPFIAGAVIILTVASLTVSSQIFRAACANPADIIRYE